MRQGNQVRRTLAQGPHAKDLCQRGMCLKLGKYLRGAWSGNRLPLCSSGPFSHWTHALPLLLCVWLSFLRHLCYFPSVSLINCPMPWVSLGIDSMYVDPEGPAWSCRALSTVLGLSCWRGQALS